jgi:hypothetical protein
MRDDGIPRSFSLGPHKIKVVNVPVKKWLWGENVLAMWMPSECRIEIVSTLKGTYRQTVFLHEVVHAICDTAGYYEISKDEEFADRFAVLLQQMLTTMK